MSNTSSSSSGERAMQRRRAVEIIFPSQAEAAADFVDDGVSIPRVCATASATVAPSAGSGNMEDPQTLIDKALAELPQELADLAKDPKNHARSKDPGWKYGFWPNETKKEMVQCIFCKKVVPAGIRRFKQHLCGGFGDTEKCPKAPAIVRKEMRDYLVQNTRSKPTLMEEENVQTAEEECEGEVVVMPSSGTKAKETKRKVIAQASITSFVGKKYVKSVSSMLCKTPEEVVNQRHSSTSSQPTLEHCTKKSKEAKQIVDDHVADFFYENGIPLNAINSRSWEIMVESIGQYGPGYRSPSYNAMREPQLERAVVKINDLRKRHEESWMEYGCTLMSDGWTDQRHRHLINFLANSPAGTFFIGSVDASSQVADGIMLANLLEKQIEMIGKEYVVHVVTDNGANFKAAGRILMERIPTLFWTPCAAHCLDLLLEDLGKIKDFSSCINDAKKVSRFIYKHGRILDMMRAKVGGDLVRPAVTRFATSFLTLASMHRHKQALKNLFVSEDWYRNKLSTSEEGKAAENIVLSVPFWNHVENCLKASQPILIALRIADGDETPAVPEIMSAMNTARTSIKESLKNKPSLLNEVLGYFEKRWENQMEQKLYGAALFLNPAKSQMHTKRRNRLEHKRLNKLVYVSYNRKMANRFTKIRELGSKGKRSNPLHLEEFQWESEWVVADNDSVHQGAAHDVGDLTRGDVDEAIGASQGLSGRNLPRAAAAHARNLWTNEFPTRKRTSRKRPRQAEPTINENEILEDDEESESEEMQKNGEDGSGPSSSFGNENAFQVDEDLL